MSESLIQMQAKIKALEEQVALLKQNATVRRIRKRSEAKIFGFPLYDISVGPDPERGEIRGHARGIVGIGDLATGFIALGGLARGISAIGGGANGLVALGGGAIGLLAFGGAAFVFVSVGGGACGYYACGGSAFGKYALSAAQQDREAIRFFQTWIPGIAHMVRQRIR